MNLAVGLQVLGTDTKCLSWLRSSYDPRHTEEEEDKCVGPLFTDEKTEISRDLTKVDDCKRLTKRLPLQIGSKSSKFLRKIL